MPNHLSILGIIHTAISILALVAAFVALFQTGIIDPVQRAGRAYVILTVIACLTAFPIMRTGHFGPGHVLGVIVLVGLVIAIYARISSFVMPNLLILELSVEGGTSSC
jgi:hypothetical protein